MYLISHERIVNSDRLESTSLLSMSSTSNLKLIHVNGKLDNLITR